MIRNCVAVGRGAPGIALRFIAIAGVAIGCSDSNPADPPAGLATSGQDAASEKWLPAAVVTATDASTCSTLPTVNRVRLLAASGRAQGMVGGKIRGSNESPTNAFVDLFTIQTPPAEGQWMDVAFANSVPYRYVKYDSPPQSYGIIAELELYHGAERLTGKGFGTAGSRSQGGDTFEKALDANPSTYFEGPLASGNYVGLDLASDATPALHARKGPSLISYAVDATAPIALQSSVHIGNSLTDTIVGHLDVAAKAGGIQLDFHRYTIPGAGTDWLWDHPTGGFGETDIQQLLRSSKFDHLSMQPFQNGPCTPSGAGSDGDYVNRFYDLAKQTNPNVVLWIYQQWPMPNDWSDCFSAGASWQKPPWTPPLPNPATWEDAVGNQLAYQEAVRAAVMALNPSSRAIYIVPGGLALRALKHQVEAGQVPGMTRFFESVFDQNGTDLHLTEAGRYFITLVFYACMFQKSPQGLAYVPTAAPADQAAKLQEIAWQAVTAYALSGVNR